MASSSPLALTGLDLDPSSAPSMAMTGTDLDIWFGGLARTGPTIVTGLPATGKTMFLWCLLRTGGAPGSLIWAGLNPLPSIALVGATAPDVAPRIVMRRCTTLETVLDFLSMQSLDKEDIVVIDDFDLLRSSKSDVAASTKARANICKMLGARETPCVLSAQKTATLGRGVHFSAQLILDLQQIARTGEPHEGTVVRAEVKKSRWTAPTEMRSLWLRPGNPRPLTFA